MYHLDHAPPHFHAIYGQYEAEIDIASGRILKGRLPRRAERFIREWLRAYRSELGQDWDLARAHQPLMPIPPLE